MEYENLIKSNECTDLGTAIQSLINDNIKALRISFLAQIVEIQGNKISFKKLIRANEKEAVLIVNNVLIGFPYSQEWQTQFKLKVGDIGLIFILDNDLTIYKKGGVGGFVTNARYRDLNDCIFFPLSMHTTRLNSQINYIIENNGKTCKLEFNNNEIGTLKAKLITIQSENTTLKAKMQELAGLLESLASSRTEGDSYTGKRLTNSPESIGKFSAWANSLNELFKD